MHLENGGLLTWRYKNLHDFLLRHLLDVIFYYVVMYFDDIYYVLMMFGRMRTIKWDPGILFQNGMGWRALLIVGVQYKQHLEIVLKTLQEQSLYAKISKFEFWMK